MTRRLITLALAAAAPLALGGCAYGYGYTGVDVGYGGYGYPGYGYGYDPYDVWYDGYYGPFYNGYWGTDGFFYYQLYNDRHWYRGDRDHFHHGGDRDGDWHHDGDRDGNHDRDGDHNRDGSRWHHYSGSAQPGGQARPVPGWGGNRAQGQFFTPQRSTGSTQEQAAPQRRSAQGHFFTPQRSSSGSQSTASDPRGGSQPSSGRVPGWGGRHRDKR